MNREGACENNLVKMCCYAFMLVTLALAGIVSPCHAATAAGKTSSEEVKRETEDLLQTLKSYGAEHRDEAVQKTKAALDKLDERIEALETRIDNKWDSMDKAAREKARASLKVLRQQRMQVAEWYGSLKNSSVHAWGYMKKGFSSAYRALHETWEKSEKEFGSDR